MRSLTLGAVWSTVLWRALADKGLPCTNAPPTILTWVGRALGISELTPQGYTRLQEGVTKVQELTVHLDVSKTTGELGAFESGSLIVVVVLSWEIPQYQRRSKV